MWGLLGRERLLPDPWQVGEVSPSAGVNRSRDGAHTGQRAVP